LPSQPKEDGENSVLDLLIILAERKRFFFLVIAAFAILAAAILLLSSTWFPHERELFPPAHHRINTDNEALC
jgi:hypothetical protein